jgi:hypothetical protein
VVTSTHADGQPGGGVDLSKLTNRELRDLLAKLLGYYQVSCWHALSNVREESIWANNVRLSPQGKFLAGLSLIVKKEAVIGTEHLVNLDANNGDIIDQTRLSGRA